MQGVVESGDRGIGVCLWLGKSMNQAMVTEALPALCDMGRLVQPLLESFERIHFKRQD